MKCGIMSSPNLQQDNLLSLTVYKKIYKVHINVNDNKSISHWPAEITEQTKFYQNSNLKTFQPVNQFRSI